MIYKLKSKTLILIMTAVVLTASLFGCGKKEGADKTLNYPISAEPACLDPQTAGSSGELTVLYNSMVTPVIIDENGEAKGFGAVSWDISADGTVYTFHLREDIKWHLLDTTEEIIGSKPDERVTAQDFAFGITRTLLPETKSPYADNFSCIKNAEKVLGGEMSAEKLGVSAPDSRTLRITLEKKNPDFIYEMASCGAMPCNKAFFEATGGRYGLDVDYFLACGAFYLSKWNHDASLILRKNDTYFNTGEVKPASVVLYIQEDSLAPDELAGDKLSAALLPAEYSGDFSRKKYNVTEYQSDTFAMMVCSNALSALGSADMRRAFALAMNTDEFMTEGRTPADGIVPDFCRVGSVSYRETAGKAHIPQTNAALARELWDKELGRLGLKNLEITVLCAEDDEKEVRNIIKQWQNVFGIGFSAKIAVVKAGEAAANAKNGIYQIAFTRVSANSSSALSFLEMLGDSYGVVSKSYSELLKSAMRETDSAEKIKLLAQCEDFLIQNGYFYPIYKENSLFVLSRKTENVSFSTYACVPIFERGESFA